MLRNVVRSGVAFSHDPSTCSPFRIINWSDGTDTTSVTAGKSGNTWQCAAHSPVEVRNDFANVVTLIEELVALFNDNPIDRICSNTECEEDGYGYSKYAR